VDSPDPEIPRHQIVLWQRRLDYAIAEDHPVGLLDELLNSPRFTAVVAELESGTPGSDGRPAYHPQHMMALYIYCMLHRRRSTRQMGLECHRNLEVIWLMSGQTPDHSTISLFVNTSKERIKKMFRAVVEIGIKAQFVKLDHVSVDGTIIDADSGRGSIHDKAWIEKRAAEPQCKIAEMEQELDENEKRDGLLGSLEARTGVDRKAGKDAKGAQRRVAEMKRKQELINPRLGPVAADVWASQTEHGIASERGQRGQRVQLRARTDQSRRDGREGVCRVSRPAGQDASGAWSARRRARGRGHQPATVQSAAAEQSADAGSDGLHL